MEKTMTQEEIIKNNALIAEFMDMMPNGYEINNPLSIPAVTRTNSMFYVEDYKEMWEEDGGTVWDAYEFHQSWDWLMPCIHTIRDTVNIDFFFEEYDDWRETVQQIDPYNYDLKHCYRQTVEFIKWYNESEIKEVL